MKTLIVGLGFGQLYKRIYESMGAEIITVDADQSRQPDFVELTTAIDAHHQFDTAHICTPNKTHFALAKALYCFSASNSLLTQSFSLAAISSYFE